MIGPVIFRTLTTHWRQMLYWGVGLALLVLYMISAISPDAIKGFAGMLKNFPPAIAQLIGISDPELLTTPDGFLSLGFAAYAPLVLAIFAISAGLNVTANEEEEKLLDVVLSWPLPRWQLLLGRILGWTIITLGIVGLVFVGMLAGRFLGGAQISLRRGLETCINLLPSTLLILTLTVMVSATLRRRWMVTSIVGTFVALSYFLRYLSEAFVNDVARAAGKLSYFTYYDNAGVSLHGLNMGNWLLLTGIAGVFLLGALWLFQRRDVGL